MLDSLSKDEIPEFRPKDPNIRYVPKYWVVLGVLIFVHAAFGAYLNPIGTPVGVGGTIGRYMIMGVLVSQPILFAIWAAFAPQRFYHRFLWSFLLCTLVSFIEEFGKLRHINYQIGNTMMFLVILFFITTFISLLVRRFTRWQIIRLPDMNLPDYYQANQFGIKQLIILTTITAIAFALFSTLLNMNQDLRWLPSLIQSIGLTCLTLVWLFPVIVIPWYTLADYQRNTPPIIILMMILWVIIDVACFIIIYRIYPMEISEMIDAYIEPSLSLQLGAGLSGFVSTLVIRLCGFRVIQKRK
jgi:hypothetical protein